MVLRRDMLLLAGVTLAAGCSSAAGRGPWPGRHHGDAASGPTGTGALAGLPTFYEDNPTYLAGGALPVWPSSSPQAQNVDPVVLAAGEQMLTTVPQALSFLVIRNGYLVKESYLHGSAPNHSNNIHSASKGIISALVGLALQGGQLRGLDQTIGELLPSLSISDPKKRGITLGHLLTMSAGLAWTEDSTEYKIETQPDWAQSIVDLPLVAPPGTAFNYSTGQSHLVSAILTAATGMPTRDFARTALFEPLGIGVEHWGRDPKGVDSGGYNVYMTPRALAKFAELALEGGRSRGRQVLPADWLKASWRTSQPVDAAYTYGYYWWLVTLKGHAVYKLWGHGGQFAILIPDLNTAVVLTADTTQEFEELDADAFVETYVIPALR